MTVLSVNCVRGRRKMKTTLTLQCDECQRIFDRDRRIKASLSLPYHFCGIACSSQSQKSGGKLYALKRDVFITKYGVDNPFEDEGVKDRIKQTNLQRHGVEWLVCRADVHAAGIASAHTDVARAKRHATCVSKYGVNSFSKTQAFKDVVVETNRALHGVDYCFMKPSAREKAAVNSHTHEANAKRSVSNSGQRNGWSGLIVPWFKPWMSDTRDHGRWARVIVQMFGHHCARCDSSVTLHAHHIVPMSVSIERSFDLNNGICLCRKCHAYVHRILRKYPGVYQQVIDELMMFAHKEAA